MAPHRLAAMGLTYEQGLVSILPVADLSLRIILSNTDKNRVSTYQSIG